MCALDLLYCAYMKKTRTALIVVAIIIVMVAVGYYFYNKMAAQRTAELQQEERLASFYPKPPEVVNNNGGTVKGIYGAMLLVETPNMNDYLPHADGSPRTTSSIALNITNTTVLSSVSLSDGREVPMRLSNIKIGDTIRFWSDANVRTAKQADATIVQIIR